MEVFRIIGEFSPIHVIPGRHSKANDLMVVKDGKRRELRYCPNETSIWADEQNKKSKSTNPIFKNGEIRIDKDKNPTLIEFLETTPYFNKLYKKVDITEEAAKNNSKKEKKIQAGQLILNAKEKEVRNIAKVMFPVLAESNASLEVLKERLYDIAEMNPDSIIRGLSSDEGKKEFSLEALVKDAVQKEVIYESEDKKSVLWKDTSEALLEKHHLKSVEKALIEFLSNADNSGVLEEMKTKLSD